ncbi:hypothetical protein DINM_001052 [Dirofilaria immitis]|nr:hypothetical protein [Dirofilaria immitis]
MELDSKKVSENGEINNRQAKQFEVPPEMQRDISKLMGTISELEPQAELRIEKEHKKIIENELMELKRMMLQSDNQKLISMATKVELLNNQLLLVNDRCSNLHRRIVKEGGSETAYMDSLKNKCEELERQLSEQKATNAINCSQIDSATTDEIEQCCEVLASVEAQTNRICKQIEKIDSAQKDERRRSLSKDSSATIITELASVMSELKNVHQLLEAHKVNIASVARGSPAKNVTNELTNQVLQTEDRWTAEIEKQRQSYENEQEHLLESRAVALAEKIRMDIEADRRSAKEFEIKYKKLESMFNLEKEKLAEERAKSKSEVTILKKKSEETLNNLEKLRNSYVKKENAWQEKHDRLENELASLKQQLNKDNIKNDIIEELLRSIPFLSRVGKKQPKLSVVLIELPNIVPDLNSSSIPIIHHSTTSTVATTTPIIVNSKNDDLIDLKDQIATLQKKNKELTNQISEAKRDNEDLRMELATLQQKWTKDKNDLLHKARQEEKIRNVELDALQQKFTSRMRIMEDTNKSLHSQLVQARRERDYHREALHTFESKISEEQRRGESDVKRYKELEEKSTDMTKQITNLKEEVTKLNIDLKLAKEAHEADRALWNVEKSHLNTKKIETLTDNSSDSKTINNIKNAKIPLLQITESALKTAEMLREQIKVLEISQRNLMEARDMQLGAKEFLENELERLQEVLNLNEVHRLTRKYKLSLIIEQLQALIESLNKSSKIGTDSLDNLKAFVSQLMQMKENECKPITIGNRKKQNKLNEHVGPVEVESDTVSQAPSDAISQSSTPARFYSYSTLPTSSYKLTATVRNLSESNSAVEIRHLEAMTNGTQLPIKKISSFPDPPPTLILNKEMAVEYDKDGRLHYIPKIISHSASGDDRQVDNGFSSYEQDDGEDSSSGQLHLRTNSTGTNILYDIRRVELARGSQPSVRLMAKAFETMEANATKTLPNSKRSLFGIRKSRSALTPLASSPVAVTVLGRNTSLSHIEELMGSQSPFGNISRGSRNPFKIMKTKLVERVRRSLSRSNSKNTEIIQQKAVIVAGAVVKNSQTSSSPTKKAKRQQQQQQQQAATTTTTTTVAATVTVS